MSARVRRDARKDSRTTLELPVLVSDGANKVKGGIRFGTSDVSVGGAFLRSDLLFEVGELFNLEFQLPSGKTIRAKGRVVRVSRDATKDRVPGMGVEFIHLSPQDRAAIEERLE